ncbi:MAG: ABC transporter substrate-binding protein [Thermodesulfobacteriota bacterium]|nr:ABC transporter substrate-binding protein [Thermodesulfobacteriota bacterium]
MGQRLFIGGLLLPSYVLIITGFLVCSVVSGYANEGRGVTDTTIKIGGIADHTGPVATICTPIIEALKNYTRHINDQGGIHGRKIKLLMEDDRYSIPAGVAAFKKLVYKDKVLALLGPVSIGETKPICRDIY